MEGLIFLNASVSDLIFVESSHFFDIDLQSNRARSMIVFIADKKQPSSVFKSFSTIESIDLRTDDKRIMSQLFKRRNRISDPLP